MREYSILLAQSEHHKEIEHVFASFVPNIIDLLTKENIQILLATKGAHIIGISILDFSVDSEIDAKTCKVLYLYVLKEYLSRGINNGLLLRSELMAREKNCKKIYLHYQDKEIDVSSKGFSKLVGYDSSILFFKHLS